MRVGAEALRLRRPEALLLAAVALAIGLEALIKASGQRPPGWYLPPALVVGAALLVVTRSRDELRPAVVVGLSALLCLGFFAVHRALGLPLPDADINSVYPRYGHELLNTGQLPQAEYPPGALLAFAGAAWLGPVYITLPLLTLPLLLAAWWALASSRARAASIVAIVALWPTLEYFWETKFDAIPVALFVLGMVAASRERWGWAGLAFGFGAAAKWWPALVAITLAAALIRRRELRSCALLAATTAIGPLLTYLPFLGSAEITPYRVQGGREVMGESLPFLALHLVNVVGRPRLPWEDAGGPSWTRPASFVLLALVLALIVYAAWRRPQRALSLAATSAVAFFLLNRVFSAQFMLPVAAAWACALVLGGEIPTARVQRRFLVLFAIAATADYAVYPAESQQWVLVEWVQFAAAIAATFVVLAATRARPVRPGALTRSDVRAAAFAER